jgi:hypothetical protein
MSRWPKPALAIALPAILLLALSEARADGRPAFALVVHVATTRPAEIDPRLDTLLGAANRHFTAAGIEFEVDERRELPESFAVLETIRERRQLGKFFVPRRINVYLVDEIRDPTPSAATRRAARAQGRKPSGRLSGAHVPIRGRTPGTYIIVARTRSAVSLAHELGHFFGVPHSEDPTNIMSYGSDRDHFDERQLDVFRRHARRFRRARAVRLLPPAAAAAEPVRPARFGLPARMSYTLPPHRGPHF